ncbi:CD1375 family protein [Shouchella hunanensis]|uniref:CD1375 family protein n=1 Tax=Shouchella hunanensis TaxID=766894 RepID=A0ABY7WAN1_9BACI|nr:CD1375 family protein [Shouchella hunanensis]WDF05945.1 CD1375 family protein [Shouchella hunanensis]
MLYANRIIAGVWTFDRVAATWKEEVRVLLIEYGRSDLIT